MTCQAGRTGLDGESDEALLAAIAARAERAAFAELFRRFAGRIKAFIIRAGTSPDMAEEVAQEVMVTVWRKAAAFDPAKASAATWIYTIARNRRIDLHRRESRPEPDPEDPLFRPETEDSAERRLASADRDGRLRAALSDLPGEQIEVLQLAFFAGLSHSEIAVRLDMPLGTVKSRLRLSFVRLRGALGEGFSAELVDD